MPYVFVVEQDKCVKFDLIFFASLNGLHHFIKAAAAGMVNAIIIVKFFGAIDTNTDKKLIVVHKLTPFIIEQNCIGLQGVAYLLAGGAIFFLQFDCPFVEIQTHQRRFTPLPGKAGDWERELNIIFNELLEHFIAHSLFSMADLGSSIFIKAVLAIEIAI